MNCDHMNFRMSHHVNYQEHKVHPEGLIVVRRKMVALLDLRWEMRYDDQLHPANFPWTKVRTPHLPELTLKIMRSQRMSSLSNFHLKVNILMSMSSTGKQQTTSQLEQ